MVHPISPIGGGSHEEQVSPTEALTSVTQGLESLLQVMQSSGKDYLADLSPSQVIGRLDYINAFTSQMPNSPLAKDISTMINTLEPLVAPYNDLPDDDLQAWVDGGQTSFPDYNNGASVPSFSAAFNSLMTVGQNLGSDLKGFTLTTQQYNTGIHTVLSNIIDTMNANGYGTDPSNAFLLGGLVTSMSDDPIMSSFPNAGAPGDQESALATDALSWGETWGVDPQGSVFQGGENYTNFNSDFQTFLNSIENTPYGKDLPPFNPPAAPSSPPS